MAKELIKLLFDVSDVILTAVNDEGNISGEQMDTLPMVHLGFQADDGVLELEGSDLSMPEGCGGKIQFAHDFKAKTSSLEVLGSKIPEIELFKRHLCDIYAFGRDSCCRVKKIRPSVIINGELGVQGKSLITLQGSSKVGKYSDGFEGFAEPEIFNNTPAGQFKKLLETVKREKTVLEVYPYLGNFYQYRKLYDIAQRLKFNIDPACQWEAMGSFGYMGLLLLVPTTVSFGNIFNDDGVSNFIIEMWVNYIREYDEVVPLLSKIGDYNAGPCAGWRLFTDENHKLKFLITDGSNTVNIESATEMVAGPHHIAVAVNRNNHARLYIDGSMTGIASNIMGVTSAANGNSLMIGSDGTGYIREDDIEFAALRIHNYGEESIDGAAALIAHNFNAEKGNFYSAG